MHFAYPPRKSSNPPPFRPKSSPATSLRRGRKRTLGLIGVGFLFLLYVLLGRSESLPTSKGKHVPSGSPPVVMITIFNSEHGLEYKNTIKENRLTYAQRHGK
ncbi:hypothetical protein IMZ48_14290 [Candidatus Bathyarchaeota archaeon]|nr:hypothetical protein [Candidatus Bathyarchaeota archaeon]